MFPFLKFFNSKPDVTDSNDNNDSSSDLSNLEVETYNNKPPVAFEPIQTNTAFGVKRRGDFSANICHPQKKARTRNNEILSSYSSSKFLWKPGQKRSYQTDNEDELPDRKHCKSCLCCGSTVLSENDQNILNENVRTTENGHSDDFVTVAAGRIFNRSGKTQVIKKMPMKTILNEVLDDVDLTPYTSIEKVQKNKKNSQNKVILLKQHTDKSDEKNIHHSENLTIFVPLTDTGILSVESSAASRATINTASSESIPKISEGNKNASPLQLDFDNRLMNNSQMDSSSFVIVSQVENSSKPSAFTFNASKSSENLSTRIMQFGVPMNGNQQSLATIQIGNPEMNETPDIQFDDLKIDGIKSAPFLQFGTYKLDDKQSTPLIKFDVSNSDNHQSVNSMQFGTIKESDNSICTSFSFDNNAKSSGNIKSAESEKFQFSSPTSDNTLLTESKNVCFVSNNSQNLVQTDDATLHKSTPKLPLGALPNSVCEISNAHQSKPSAKQPIDNRGPKLAFSFGSPVSANKPATSDPNIFFTNNTEIPSFQLNKSSCKLNDKVSDVPCSSPLFSSTEAVSSFVTSDAQDFGVKTAFRCSFSKAEESKTQFSTPVFGAQSTTTAPFKFGGDNKPASFGSPFSNQPLRCANSMKKPMEPFKFGSTVLPGSAFKFGANKSKN